MKVDLNGLIIAVDFDGSVCHHKFPEMGEDIDGAVETLKEFVAAGVKLILWTVRRDEQLQEAINWYKEREIPLYGVNKNPDFEANHPTASPKAYANLYIDDMALGAPLVNDGVERPYIDWYAVKEMVFDGDFCYHLKKENAAGPQPLDPGLVERFQEWCKNPDKEFV